MVDLVCLRSFAHVCESGTVAAAAGRLGYTAPAVSQQLAKLERDLGVTLFDRAGGRLRPTEPGRALLEVAGEMLDLAERCRHLEPGTGRAEPVTVTAFGSAVAEIIAPALRRLPAGAVIVRGGDDDAALRELRLGWTDVAIVQEYEPRLLRREPRFAVAELARDELRLVLPPSWPAGARLVDVGDLPWLLNGDGTHCTTAVRHVLDAAGVHPTIAASVDDNRALLRLVAAGLGACIVPALVLAGSVEHVTVAAERLGATRQIVAVTRRSSGGRAEPVVAALRDAATAAIRSLAHGA